MTKRIKVKSLESIGYPDYDLYSNGRLYNKTTKHWIGGTDANKLVQVMLKNENGYKTISLARLVGMVFIPKKNADSLLLSHKDGNFRNNSVENLEWIMPSEKTGTNWNNVKNAVKRKFVDRGWTRTSIQFSYCNSVFVIGKNGDVFVNGIFIGNKRYKEIIKFIDDIQ